MLLLIQTALHLIRPLVLPITCPGLGPQNDLGVTTIVSQCFVWELRHMLDKDRLFERALGPVLQNDQSETS